MTDREEKLIEKAQARRNDPARLTKKAKSVSVKPGSHVVSFRLPTEEFLDLMTSIEESGEKLPDYIRGAIRVRQTFDRLVGGYAIDVMSRELEESHSNARLRWFGNPLPYTTHGVPDFPPKSVAV